VDSEQVKMNLESNELVSLKKERETTHRLALARKTDKEILQDQLDIVDALTQSEAQKRCKASTSIKSLAVRCDLFQYLK
jgi:hypothetical protein